MSCRVIEAVASLTEDDLDRVANLSTSRSAAMLSGWHGGEIACLKGMQGPKGSFLDSTRFAPECE